MDATHWGRMKGLAISMGPLNSCAIRRCLYFSPISGAFSKGFMQEEVGSLVRQLVNVHNSRLRIERLQQECEELAK